VAKAIDETIAEHFYQVYCTAVGGKAFNGDPLPDWRTFRADPAKKIQSEAWLTVARFHLTILNEAVVMMSGSPA
jgi:hypothetical protein